ncbi:MAG: YqiJ family protein [Desulfobacteraceae bacterium]|nr:YqiJ family protein [Desulfobacteraceae bacterium]
MIEFFYAAVSLVNLPFTIFLGFLLLYWIAVIVGAADLELFDGDWMPDLDVEDAGGFMDSALQVLGVGEVPVMVLATVMAFSSWSFSMMANYYLNSRQSLLIGAGLLIPNLFVSLFITGSFARLVTKIFFGSGDKDEKEDQKIVFRVGVVTTSEVTSSFGQIQIQTKGAPITINARTSDDLILKKGDKALVYEEDKEKGIYYVEKFNE